MKKFQLFIVVEVVLFALAMMSLLATDIPRFFMILVLTLLVLKYYNSGNRMDFLLTVSLLIFFLMMMTNIYIIIGIIFGVIYMLINHFAQVKKKNRQAIIRFSDQQIAFQPSRNRWIGNDNHQGDTYHFDDINIIRLSGRDQINLDNVIVRGADNVIIIQKVYGPTAILVPIDVAVQLHVSSIYGSLVFFDDGAYDLRNEAVKLATADYGNSTKRVKVIINVLAGDTEVKRI
ncbi:cell wall-active antibiotics response protein LiaF [Streptococcus saliviloxodontae]|uniref:Membrane protein n=1 Tax=Streptococcus saliviloxodontae TaxID=1349416 RepID=A0ABS2PMX7_9STRE|nr:cell wall-active antibiotics response protein LiaF [Streptococcus saliviloxodontae]MBM7636783.1 putative membrane protein [Streptococcus saliviloxodontae]